MEEKEIMKFDSNLYPQKALLETVQAFNGLALFKFIEKEGEYIIEAAEIAPEARENFCHEFKNYVLASLD